MLLIEVSKTAKVMKTEKEFNQAILLSNRSDITGFATITG
jgi:hypothetical protein